MTSGESERPAATPRVSVLMTVYNAEAFLRESIESVLAQTFQDWELVAVDDGSKDSSPAILSRYTDPRVRVIALQKNIGRTPALRHAFDNARGEYIAVLDADDVCSKERFERQVEFLDRRSDVALVASWVKYIDERGTAFEDFKPTTDPQELHDCLGWTNPIVHSSVMYRRAAAAAVGGYSLDLIYAQDFGLVLKLAERHRIAMIGEFLCGWRIVSNSMSRSPQYGVTRGREGVMNFRRARQLPLSRKAARLNRRVQAVAKVELGLALLKAGSALAGIAWMLRGLASDPIALWASGIIQRRLSRRVPAASRAPGAS
jgi:glycosyltransferase involved in cell wall biosynthesis